AASLPPRDRGAARKPAVAAHRPPAAAYQYRPAWPGCPPPAHNFPLPPAGDPLHQRKVPGFPNNAAVGHAARARHRLKPPLTSAEEVRFQTATACCAALRPPSTRPGSASKLLQPAPA